MELPKSTTKPQPKAKKQKPAPKLIAVNSNSLVTSATQPTSNAVASGNVLSDADEDNENEVLPEEDEDKETDWTVLCPVCLDQFHDKSLLDVCFHAFCFLCIRKWAQVALRCPLCKQPFQSVIHQIESDDIFLREYFEEKQVKPILDIQPLFPRVRRPRRPIVWGDATPTTLERKLALSSEGLERRRRVYRCGLRARHVGSNRYSRYREITPEVFRNNPSSLLRIIPWLERELEVITNDKDVGIVRDFIVALMKTTDMQTDEVLDQLRPFLFEHTEHFIHELIAFARSPFEISMYDRYVQYEQPIQHSSLQSIEAEENATALAASNLVPLRQQPKTFFEAAVQRFVPPARSTELADHVSSEEPNKDHRSGVSASHQKQLIDKPKRVHSDESSRHSQSSPKSSATRRKSFDDYNHKRKNSDATSSTVNSKSTKHEEPKLEKLPATEQAIAVTTPTPTTITSNTQLQMEPVNGQKSNDDEQKKSLLRARLIEELKLKEEGLKTSSALATEKNDDIKVANNVAKLEAPSTKDLRHLLMEGLLKEQLLKEKRLQEQHLMQENNASS